MDSWRQFYPLIIFLGLAVSYWALRARYRHSTLTTEQKSAVGLAAFVGAMLGAKAPFLLEAPNEIWQPVWFADGKTILGGIIGGYIAVELAKSWLGITQRTGDTFAVPVALAVAVGRLGCFVAGCCYGSITRVPWAVHFSLAEDPATTLRHPTQIYEFLFHASAVAVLIQCETRQWLTDRRLAAYLLAYSVFRFCSEFLRPEPVLFLRLTAYQLGSILLAVFVIAMEIRAARCLERKRATEVVGV